MADGDLELVCSERRQGAIQDDLASSELVGADPFFVRGTITCRREASLGRRSYQIVHA